ncbi:hypothetical protein BJP08_07155 [Corynebacterium sp. NML140438]|nr:hypothetical protein BJP08_07155 [Corynebacterium sp. NML140438]
MGFALLVVNNYVSMFLRSLAHRHVELVHVLTNVTAARSRRVLASNAAESITTANTVVNVVGMRRWKHLTQKIFNCSEISQ